MQQLSVAVAGIVLLIRCFQGHFRQRQLYKWQRGTFSTNVEKSRGGFPQSLAFLLYMPKIHPKRLCTETLSWYYYCILEMNYNRHLRTVLWFEFCFNGQHFLCCVVHWNQCQDQQTQFAKGLWSHDFPEKWKEVCLIHGKKTVTQKTLASQQWPTFVASNLPVGHLLEGPGRIGSLDSTYGYQWNDGGNAFIEE